MSTDYFTRVRPTYIENWPLAVCQLSLAQVDIPLSTPDEVFTLGVSNGEFGQIWAKLEGGWQRDPAIVLRLVEQLDRAVRRFPHGGFVRLGSRSPKDSWRGHQRGFCCKTGVAAWELLTDSSERMFEDLMLAWEQKYLPHLFVREWKEIPPWAEIRCFQKNRKLVGLSQYEHHGLPVFPELQLNADGIEWAIRTWWEERFLPACPMVDVVFDVFVRRELHGNEVVTHVTLLELNPFFEMTDPCFFDWRNGGDFDGTFRYQKE